MNWDDLSEAVKKILGPYGQIRINYYNAIYAAIQEYLDGSDSITSFKNSFKNAVDEAIRAAAEAGWLDGGGGFPATFDFTFQAWLTSIQSGENSYIDALFGDLRKLRAGGDFDSSYIAELRANGYARTLDMVYNRAKLEANPSMMLTFAGHSGKESCADCTKYYGQRHKASWWVDRDAVPPNRSFECHGYQCKHALIDDNGKVWTL